MKKNLYAVITFGAVWGIFESTVGYLLHLFGLRIGWMIWFPAAYFFIHQTYCYTESFSSVLCTALIASSVKLINLFFPGRIDMVINPAISIVLEALAVMLVYKYVVNKQKDKRNPFVILLAGFTWRTLYICYILCMPQSYIDIAPFTTVNSFLEYIFLYNVVNTALITAGFFAGKAFEKRFAIISTWLKTSVSNETAMKPACAVVLIAFSIIVQVVTR